MGGKLRRMVEALIQGTGGLVARWTVHSVSSVETVTKPVPGDTPNKTTSVGVAAGMMWGKYVATAGPEGEALWDGNALGEGDVLGDGRGKRGLWDGHALGEGDVLGDGRGKRGVALGDG